MRANRFSLILFLFVIMSAVSVAGRNIEQKITRLFSFDPHPMVAEFSEPVPYKGEFLKHEVLFTKPGKAAQVRIPRKHSFHIERYSVRQIDRISIYAPIQDRQTEKGQQIAETTIGTTRLTAFVEDFSKTGPGIAELTLTFKLSYGSKSRKGRSKSCQFQNFYRTRSLPQTC